LVQNPQKREQMKERALHVRKLNSAEEIADILISLANRNQSQTLYQYQ
jgi:processive 1,2-diacylglycerol beta-glucosyltransferase